VTFAILVLAHRGAAAALAENSLAAFDLAVQQHSDGVELDVRRTADGALALSHDPMLRDGRLLLDVAVADVPDDVPTLAEALDVCRPLRIVNTEIKNLPTDPDFDPSERVAEQVVELLAERGELDSPRNLISSFHLPTIDRVHALAPTLATGWLMVGVEDVERVVATAGRHGHAAIHPHHAFVTNALVDAAHAAGLAVNTWTCDDPDRIRWLAELGVDAVVTNVPDVALAALGGLG
jgi:glycerophosphoryl diester phosphodiesterase